MSKVLVIDDEVSLQKVCSAVLKKAGHQVFCASDGREGMRLANDAPVDVVVTDILMPGQEGLETIASLMQAHPRVPIIAMSGGGTFAAEECLAMSQGLGVASVLRKPFTAEELLDVVNAALGGTIPRAR